MQDEITTLREEREKARRERTQQFKKRKLLLHATQVDSSIPELAYINTSDITSNNNIKFPKHNKEQTSRITTKHHDNTNNAPIGKYASHESATQNSSKVDQLSTHASKNDYSQHFVDTKQRPQNFVSDAELADRFEE